MGAAAAAVGAVTGVEFFQLLVPGGLAANLVLVPPALLVIVAGVGSLGLGFAGAAAAGRFCNLAAGAVLAGMTWLARAVTAVPWVYFPAHYRAAWIGPAALTALLAACLFGYAMDWRREPRRLLAPLCHRCHRPRLRRSLPSMKSSYELAMERLAKSDPSAGKPLSPEKKTRLAEIDRVYQGKVAEREIFLKKQLDEAWAAQNAEEIEKVKQQMGSERARLEEDREAEKEKIRKA